jgi:hypothetical protein
MFRAILSLVLGMSFYSSVLANGEVSYEIKAETKQELCALVEVRGKLKQERKCLSLEKWKEEGYTVEFWSTHPKIVLDIATNFVYN